jgi:hypothetical protein
MNVSNYGTNGIYTQTLTFMPLNEFYNYLF